MVEQIETEEFKIKLLSQLNEYLLWTDRKVKGSTTQSFLGEFGFQLEIRPSQIAGNGVFLAKGSIPQNTLVALYPGTVYKPWEPVFFQSIRNHVMLECIDRHYIDAKAHGLSRSIYKSCED